MGLVPTRPPLPPRTHPLRTDHTCRELRRSLTASCRGFWSSGVACEVARAIDAPVRPRPMMITSPPAGPLRPLECAAAAQQASPRKPSAVAECHVAPAPRPGAGCSPASVAWPSPLLTSLLLCIGGTTRRLLFAAVASWAPPAGASMTAAPLLSLRPCCGRSWRGLLVGGACAGCRCEAAASGAAMPCPRPSSDVCSWDAISSCVELGGAAASPCSGAGGSGSSAAGSSAGGESGYRTSPAQA